MSCTLALGYVSLTGGGAIRGALIALCSLLWVLLYAWLLSLSLSSPSLALPTPSLSPYTTGLLQGVKCHPLGISASLFVTAEPGDWCVCMRRMSSMRNRAREYVNLRIREYYSDSSEEMAGENILVFD